MKKLKFERYNHKIFTYMGCRFVVGVDDVLNGYDEIYVCLDKNGEVVIFPIYAQPFFKKEVGWWVYRNLYDYNVGGKAVGKIFGNKTFDYKNSMERIKLYDLEDFLIEDEKSLEESSE